MGLNFFHFFLASCFVAPLRGLSPRIISLSRVQERHSAYNAVNTFGWANDSYESAQIYPSAVEIPPFGTTFAAQTAKLLIVTTAFLSNHFPHRLTELSGAVNSIATQIKMDPTIEHMFSKECWMNGNRSLCGRYLIINEWAESMEAPDSESQNKTRTVAAQLEKVHTQLMDEDIAHEVVQKAKKRKGQAESLNLVLARLPEYEYWFNVEESWHMRVPEVSILPTLLEFMDSHPQVDTLGSQGGRGWDTHSLTVEETKTLGDRELELGSFHGWCKPPGWTSEILRETAVIRDDNNYKEKDVGRCGFGMFSLQPGITRSKAALLAGWFRSDLRPITFEMDWSYRFQGQTPFIDNTTEMKSVFWGVRWKKAVAGVDNSLGQDLLMRPMSHVSTWTTRGQSLL